MFEAPRLGWLCRLNEGLRALVSLWGREPQEERVQRETGLFPVPGNYTAAFFSQWVPLPWPGEWARHSGIQRWDWSGGEARCLF